MPHGLFNHHAQAQSKKSFRIRTKAEADQMKRQQSAAQSTADMNDLKSDTLKSVYELRKSHAALVNRPMSS